MLLLRDCASSCNGRTLVAAAAVDAAAAVLLRPAMRRRLRDIVDAGHGLAVPLAAASGSGSGGGGR